MIDTPDMKDPDQIPATLYLHANVEELRTAKRKLDQFMDQFDELRGHLHSNVPDHVVQVLDSIAAGIDHSIAEAISRERG